MFSTDFIFRQQENLADNQICQAGFRPLCNKILIATITIKYSVGAFAELMRVLENQNHLQKLMHSICRISEWKTIQPTLQPPLCTVNPFHIPQL